VHRFLVYFVTAVAIIILLYFFFRRPRRDARFDEHAKTIDKIAQDREQKIPEHQKWPRL